MEHTEIIMPSRSIDTNIPLYAAFGLSKVESDSAYFTLTEDILPLHKTVADCLISISIHKRLNERQKIWCAYHLKTEMLARAGVPRIILDKLESF